MTGSQFPSFSEPIGFKADPEDDNMTTPNRGPTPKAYDGLKGSDRLPSPQPAHFSVPYKNGKNGNGNGHRILRSATVGYVAPEFEGKQMQIVDGKQYLLFHGGVQSRSGISIRGVLDLQLAQGSLPLDPVIPKRTLGTRSGFALSSSMPPKMITNSPNSKG